MRRQTSIARSVKEMTGEREREKDEEDEDKMTIFREKHGNLYKVNGLILDNESLCINHMYLHIYIVKCGISIVSGVGDSLRR